MKGKALIILLFAGAVAAIVWSQRRPEKTTSDGVGGSTSAPPADAVTVTMLYGTEKRELIEELAAQFGKENPRIKLALSAAGSLDAAERILDGRELPAVFSPADSLVLNMLASDWQTKHGAPLFERDGEGAPQPLVITPLVFVGWEDRAKALEKAAGGRLSWKVLRKALAAKNGWASVGGDPDWGFVKLGHTDPTRSNSGLQTLLSMVLEHQGGNRPLAVADLLAPELQTFVKEIEQGVTKFESSTGTFMTDMVRFGPSKYDVAVVYESLAIAQIANAQGRWGNLRVYYPSPTLWSDHPVALLANDKLTAEQRAGALAWIRFLRSRAAQERALAFGFRPADPAVPIKDDPTSPFQRLASHGLKRDIPPAAQAPDGAVVRNLLTMWRRLGVQR